MAVDGRESADLLLHDADYNDNVSARRVQKADREKLRRDRLNEQFLELGKVLDPDRPKNDKASILTDTVQMVKDLTSQVNRLKAEYTALTEESRELTQEKNDLKEEKASLKADIDSLNSQYQQRLRASYPWAAIDHSVVMHPPTYPYPMPMPMPVAVPPGPIPLQTMHPYPFYGNQSHGVIPNHCPTLVPYATTNAMIEQQSAQYLPLAMQPANRSHTSSKQDSRIRSSDCHGESKIEKGGASHDVTTDLELKTPGSTTEEASSLEQRRPKKASRKENNVADGSSSSKCSSTRSLQDSSSSSVVGGRKASDQ